MVERLVGEVASKILDEGYRAQLIHTNRDKGGHEAYHIEASRNFSYSFYCGSIELEVPHLRILEATSPTNLSTIPIH